MLVLAISYILTIITPLHAHNYTPWEVCNQCLDDVDCNPTLTTCQEIAGEDMCYWANEDANGGVFGSSPDAVPEHEDNVFSLTRECTSDYDCVKFVNPRWHAKLGDGIEFEDIDTIDHHEEPIPHPPHVRVNSCLRCCTVGGEKICTQTLETAAEPCGNYFENFQNPAHDTGAQVNSYGFNTAPCCPGEICLDNVLGVCGVEVEECQPCISWNSQVVNFGEASNRIDDCAAGLFCLLDDGPGSDISFTDLEYLTFDYGNSEFGAHLYADVYGGFGGDLGAKFDGAISDAADVVVRRRLLDADVQGGIDGGFVGGFDADIYGYFYGEATHLNREFSVQNLRPKVTIRKGICVAEDGFAQDDRTCSTDANCPSCMRCCVGIGAAGIGKCVRSSGEICGLSFEGRGPCCCPDKYECCANECVTKSPTPSPTESPTPPTRNSDSGDDDSGSSGSGQQSIGNVVRQNFNNGASSSDEKIFGAKSDFGDNNRENNINGENLLSDTALDKVLFNVWCWIIIIICVFSFCWIYKHKKRREDSFNTNLVQMEKEIDINVNDI